MPVEFCFLCDDVRTEKNGKSIFIGVYLGGITAYGESFSGAFNLCCFVDLGDLKAHTFKLKATYNDESLLEGEGELGERTGPKMFLPIPIQLVNVKKSGNLVVSFALDDDELQQIFETDLTLSEENPLAQ